MGDYYVMQAHHDHCLHDQLPAGIEKLLHDYEHYYDDCIVARQFNPALGQCPEVDCNNQASLTNAANTLEQCATTAEACAMCYNGVLYRHEDRGHSSRYLSGGRLVR